MGKVIAVWGNPNCGKTTFSIKYALALQKKSQGKVIVLCCGNVTPTLPIIFPNYKETQIFSVGVPLSKTTVLKEEVAKVITTTTKNENIGVVGFKYGDNEHKYPDLLRPKCIDLISVLRNLCDYVVVDCTSDLKDNDLSEVGILSADFVYRLISPDLKSMSFYASQLPMYQEKQFKPYLQKQIISIVDESNPFPLDVVKSVHKEASIVLPYSRQIKTQMCNGELFEKTDKKYEKILSRLVAEVIADETSN